MAFVTRPCATWAVKSQNCVTTGFYIFANLARSGNRHIIDDRVLTEPETCWTIEWRPMNLATVIVEAYHGVERIYHASFTFNPDTSNSKRLAP